MKVRELKMDLGGKIMCDKCKWREEIEIINTLLYSNNDLSDSVILVLRNIKWWIEDNKHVTEKQKQAINNIFNSIGSGGPDEGDGQDY